MSLALTASVSAISPGMQTSFLATGGTEPYVYSIVPGGAGGSINASSGVYTAPAVLSSDPSLTVDTVQVTDADAATATLQILIGDALILFCDIIQKEMNLSNGRVYLWDQKINQPTDSGLYVAVGIQSCKPFANTNLFNNGDAVQSVNMLATLSVDIISRGPDARTRKEELIMALNSNYAQSQQEINSFCIGKISTQFTNLSGIDGAAIPYRFTIAVNLQYFVRKIKGVPYFDSFTAPPVTTES